MLRRNIGIRKIIKTVKYSSKNWSISEKNFKKYGDPPNKQEQAMKTILEQTELLYTDRVVSISII